jgi:proline dehydrogenase
MVSRLLAWLSMQHWLAHGAMRSPLFRRAAHRYIAGETEQEGIRAAARLNEDGLAASLDVLGERVRTPDDAREAEAAYDELLGRIRTARLDADIAIKTTHLGLAISPALCRRLLRRLLDRARRLALRVHIDMEGSACTSAILKLYRNLRPDYPNLGITVQAALYRTPRDLQDILKRRGPHTVRLVKGVYAEPASIALQAPADIQAAYARLAHALFRSRNAYPAIATHDGPLIRACTAMAQEFRREPKEFEFQLLYGVRPDLARTLAQHGYRVRIYVPYGTEWYPYWMRRLSEDPGRIRDVFRS